MTYPCVNPDHFDATDGVISPQPWMQWRHITTDERVSATGTYPVSGGGVKNNLLQSLTSTWTNNSPVAQDVYGLLTRGGSTMILTARSRANLVTKTSLVAGAVAGAAVELSRFGCGLDRGLAGLVGNEAAFGVIELQQGERTMLVTPSLTVPSLAVAPGQSITAAVEIWFTSDNWESATINGGEEGAESRYVTGETRLDLFAYPAL